MLDLYIPIIRGLVSCTQANIHSMWRGTSLNCVCADISVSKTYVCVCVCVCNSQCEIVAKFKYVEMTHIKFVFMKKLKSRLHSGNAYCIEFGIFYLGTFRLKLSRLRNEHGPKMFQNKVQRKIY